MKNLRAIHVLRAPVGGLFRHVRDLAVAQVQMGLEVGVICDSNAADSLTDARLIDLSQHLSLGLHKVPMSREVGVRDVTAWRSICRLAGLSKANTLHGHGAKGGAYARLAAGYLRRSECLASDVRLRCFYTPHGGSLHYHHASLKGRFYMSFERRLARFTDGLIFESGYSERIYRAQVGIPGCQTRLVPNGLLPEEFGEHQPDASAADVLFVGELRYLKGVDVLIDAIDIARRQRAITAMIVGDGPDVGVLRAQVTRLGLDDAIHFAGVMPSSQAFPLGRLLVLPSRAESFPYIALEAAAAGIPLLASAVGGIPEIVAGSDAVLIPAGDANALANRILNDLENIIATRERALRLHNVVATRFTVAGMAQEIVNFYVDVHRY